MIPITIYLFLLIELFAVAYLDIKVKKISNYWTIINLVVFILFLFLFPEIYKFQFHTFIYPITFITVGFILFALKIMGAGDAKYLFSFFLLIPKLIQDHFFIALLWTTIIIGLTSLIVTIIQNFSKIYFALKNRQIYRIKEVFGSKFPYAPVIFLAWIWIGWVFQKKIFVI